LTLTGPISTLGEELDIEFANQVKGKLILLAAKVLEFDPNLEEDIKTIFQKNRNIFDAMKAEYPKDYEDVLEKFKQAKTNLIKE
jgi:DNA-directed RNA polymerase subunit F